MAHVAFRLGRRPLLLAACLLALIAACSRDSETALRDRLSLWFYLGETLAFESRMRCTGAAFRVTVPRPREALEVQIDIGAAQTALVARGIAAIARDDATPEELAEALLMTGTGAFGREVLRAAATAEGCFDDPATVTRLRAALTRPGAMLAYDTGSEGLILLDHSRGLLFYVAGDIF